MLVFQLANYRRICQDEHNTLQTLCLVLAGVFSCSCNEQFKNVHGLKIFYRNTVDFTGGRGTPSKTANPRNITCQRTEPYVLLHLKPGYWINTPHPNLACSMSIPHRRLIWPLNPYRLFALASPVSAQTAYKTGCHPSVHGTQLKPGFRQQAWEEKI